MYTLHRQHYLNFKPRISARIRDNEYRTQLEREGVYSTSPPQQTPLSVVILEKSQRKVEEEENDHRDKQK